MALRTDRQARVLIAVYGTATAAALLAWLSARWDGDTSPQEAFFGMLNIPVSHSLISVVVLFLVTTTLIGRKRIGLWAVALFQVAGAYVSVSQLLGASLVPRPYSWAAHDFASRAADLTSVAAAVLALIWLLRLRRQFLAPLQHGSWRRAVLVLGTGGAVAVLVTWALLSLDQPGNQVAHIREVGIALGRSLGDSDFGNPATLRGVPDWIPNITAIIVSITILLAVAAFLRSARPPSDWTPEKELLIRRILAKYGDADSLGYFATRRDKSSIVSPDGRAVLTYRVINGVSLASADPVGDRDSWPVVVDAWIKEARTFGWTPGVLGASEDGAKVYVRAGLMPLNLGDEAILHPDRFHLDSPAMTPVRHAVKRAERAGLVVKLRRQSEIAPAELEELIAKAEEWRGDEPDRGFSMALNREGDPADPENLWATARDASGVLMGLLSFVPWGRGGVSLDLMRRNPAAPNGVTELLVTEVVQNSGARRISLNFCVFRTVYADAERLGASVVTRTTYSVLARLDRFFQLERLYASNNKYAPEWRPRYVLYDGRLSMPQVGIAAGIAEGFLPRSPFSRPESHPDLPAEQVAEVLAIGADRQAPVVVRADQTRQRIAHLHDLVLAGEEPYPAGGHVPADRLGTVWQHPPGSSVEVAARVQSVRDHGGVLFVDLRDEDGNVVQGVCERAHLDRFAEFSRLVDRGDLLLLTGTVGASRTGTPSLLLTGWHVLAKSLAPMPFRSFTDPEARLRARSLDLIVNADVAAPLRARSAVVRALREVLEEDGYLEVETPILQRVHGGATARPFRTWINAYGLDLTLRIAPELYLKRLVVGGLGAVFEIGRNFRNEGADATHNPEFTSLEAYRPYADYTGMRTLTERLVRAAAMAVHGVPALPLGEVMVDISEPFGVVPVLEAVSVAVGTPVTLDMDFDSLLGLARAHGVPVRSEMGPGAVIEALYGDLVEPATTRPTFFVDFPAETSPLTRPHRSEPGLVERWDLVINGVEVGTAYSELTDPLLQRQRLTEQSWKAAAGDLEAMEVDEDFLAALELGMPPCGGLGLGVDRLAMLVTGGNIRSVLTFPFVRPRQR